MSRLRWLLHAAWLSVMLAACSELETQYFKDRINDATMDRVAKRYGAPHKSVRLEGERIAWTYFDRGSGTASYSGFSLGGVCHAYVLTFDRDEVLREWRHEDCQN